MYSNVLAAIDLDAESADPVLAHARRFCASDGVFSVLHVVEPQYVQYSFDPSFKGTVTRSLEEDALDMARRRLVELCEPHGVDAANQFVVLGRAADQIHALAKARGAGLVVVGSHGREGLRRLLGSTANAVLHGAGIDVATIRIGRPPR